MTFRSRLRTMERALGAALDQRRARKAVERAEYALQGHVAPSVSFCPGAKCPFCGKLLKHVTGYLGARRYAVCHHCGRNAYDSIGGLDAVLASAESAKVGVSTPDESARLISCANCGAALEASRHRRCPRCGEELP
jgi:ribosomal protein S27E